MSAPKLPKGPISARDLELLKERMLRDDPEYRSRVEAVEKARNDRAQKLRVAERPIVTDLHNAGVWVDSVWDLVNTSQPYPQALPVLVEHLERGGYPDRVMESLGRALAVKPAVAFWDQLKARYLSPATSGEEEGAAIALAACATKAQVEDLIDFLLTSERGQYRIYFVRPILILGGSRGRAVIEGLRSDPVLGKEARSRLARRSGGRPS